MYVFSSVFLLIQPMTTFPRVAPPTIARPSHVNHQPRKCPDQAAQGKASAEVPSSKMSTVCVKLTQEQCLYRATVTLQRSPRHGGASLTLRVSLKSLQIHRDCKPHVYPRRLNSPTELARLSTLLSVATARPGPGPSCPGLLRTGTFCIILAVPETQNEGREVPRRF